MTDTEARPLSAAQNLADERRQCGECRESALGLCPWHAGYEVGIRARSIEFDAARAGLDVERLAQAAARNVGVVGLSRAVLLGAVLALPLLRLRP